MEKQSQEWFIDSVLEMSDYLGPVTDIDKLTASFVNFAPPNIPPSAMPASLTWNVALSRL